MDKIKDLTGQKFGKLTAIKPIGKKNKKTVWLCKCDCGNTSEVIGTALTIGGTKSCGCLRLKHGMFGTRLYNIWHSMKERCYVSSQTSYKNYGGRGIKVCLEWQDFIPFMKWSYENGYDEHADRGQCTLDRIDPNGDYCPENCRWVSMSIQANNKTDNVFIEYNGKIDTLTNHARTNGINPGTAESRRFKGKSVEEILKKPQKRITIKYNEKEYTVDELSEIVGVSRSVLYKKVVRNGESLFEVINSINQNKRKPMVKNRPVFQYDLFMNFIRKWDNLNHIQNETGFKKGTIGSCCLGYNKTAYGYIWKYD